MTTAGNSFGHSLKLTTFGESHGVAIGAILDGVPSQIPLTEADIQPYLDKRRPGSSKFTTQRQEKDQVKILSGTFDNVTTGTPIGLMIENTDQRSRDYGDIANKFRPGHADYVYLNKYGIRDYRGGGRSSARETAMRVAAGGIARKIIADVKITGALVSMGEVSINYDNWQDDEINNNPFFCPDATAATQMAEYLADIRKQGSSVGAVIEVRATNVPHSLGEPVYDKLDADIAKAMMSINAVKGVEIGAGFNAAKLRGEDNADDIIAPHQYSSNHAGGIVGGISTGQDIVVRFAVKPTSSILKPRQTIDIDDNQTEIITKGRHDPCVGIRATPVGEAMLALVLADHQLRAR
jgi:chorismate synthase